MCLNQAGQAWQAPIDGQMSGAMKRQNQQFPRSIIFGTTLLSISFLVPGSCRASDWEELVDSTETALLKQRFREAELNSLEIVRIAIERHFALPKLLKGLDCLGEAYAGEGNLQMAEKAFEQAIAVHSQIPASIRLTTDLATIEGELADVHAAQCKWLQAENEWKSVKQCWQEAVPVTTEELVTANAKLARVYLSEGKLADAIETANCAEKMSAGLKYSENLTWPIQSILAFAYAKQNKHKEAEEHFRRAFTILERRGKQYPFNATEMTMSYADCLTSVGKLDEALSVLRQVENLHNPAPQSQARCLVMIGHIYDKQHQYRQAASYYERAAHLLISSNASRTLAVDALLGAATDSVEAHDFRWSERICDEVIPMMATTYGNDDFYTASILCHAGNVAGTLGNAVKAETLYKKALDAELNLQIHPTGAKDEVLSKEVIGLLTNTVEGIAQIATRTKHSADDYAFLEERLKACPNDRIDRRLLKRLITRQLGEMAAQMGKLDDSLQFCQEVISQQEREALPEVDLPRVLETMASVYERQQKHKLATEALSRAKTLRASKV
jgi:tetratricopeptide (TPR) repeat protein